MKKDLIPFDREKYDFSIDAILKKNKQNITITFNITGNSSEINFPVEAEFKRKDDLWKDTCFELFLLKENGQYFEINFSPSKEFNIYKFNKYREGMRSSTEVELKVIKNNQKQIVLVIKNSEKDIFKYNICTVINSNNHLSYWSVCHQNKPDFHLSKNFINLV